MPGDENADASPVIPAKAGIHAATKSGGRPVDACLRRHDGESWDFGRLVLGRADQELRIELMTVQIEHFKSQMEWEPWKVVILAIGAGAAFATAFIAVATVVLHTISR